MRSIETEKWLTEISKRGTCKFRIKEIQIPKYIKEIQIYYEYILQLFSLTMYASMLTLFTNLKGLQVYECQL